MFYNQGNFNLKPTWGDDDKPQGSNKNSKTPVGENQAKKNSNDVMDILDNEVARRILNDFKAEGGFKKRDNPVIQSKGHIPTSKPSNPKDNDLLATMAGRLAKLEATCNAQREEIKEKTRVIDKLQSELGVLKQDNNAEGLLKLKEENEGYQKQIKEMEKFLSDYGLKWVGAEEANKNKDKFDVNALNKDIAGAKPIYKSKLPKEIDINLIAKRIEELNILTAQDGESEIVRQNGAHIFKKKEPLPIAFYKDGLILKGYPFYKYSSREARQIIEDILDGYFPSVLKHKYPEGTFFKLHVKLDEDFGASISSGNRMNDFGSLEDKIFQPLSKEAFLKELPKEVIKNGKIIPIRDAIAQKLGASFSTEPTPQEIAQDGVVNVVTSISEKEKNGQLTPEQIKQLVTLKIRTESGKRTVVIKVLYTEKISSVYKLVKDYSETKKFEIWGGYPPQAYLNNEKTTLEDLEVFSDSIFNLRAL